MKGVIYYGAGGAIGFDTLCAKTVIKFKAQYSQVKLILVLPCKNQDKLWNKWDKTEYAKILKQADKIVYTSETYDSKCMHKRNKHLVDFSGHCICHLNKTKGGTFHTVTYAKSQGIKVINLPILLQPDCDE